MRAQQATVALGLAVLFMGAVFAGEEDVKGSLSPGKLADLVVIDRDPFMVDPSELKDLKVLLTIVGGRITYDSAARPRTN